MHLPAQMMASGGVRDIADVRAIESVDPQLSSSDIGTYTFLARALGSAPESGLALSFFLRSEDYEDPFTWTHREWLGCITQAANMFRRLGLQRGDVVAFVLPNLPETHLTLWGGEAAGIVFPVNPLLEAPMLLDLLQAAKPKLLVTLAPAPGSDLWEKIAPILPQVVSLTGVLTVDPLRYLRNAVDVERQQPPSRVGSVPVLDFRLELDRAPGERLEFDPPGGDDVASYFGTGGTTGMPKIAIRTHRTEVANVQQLTPVLGRGIAGPGRTGFCGLPLFHVNAQLATGLLPWTTGAHVVLGTPQGYRAPGLLQNFWRIVERYKVNWFSGVPTVYSALMQVPSESFDISSLRYGICGAAPMPKELIARFQQETGVKIIEGYGLTEGGCVSCLNPAGGECRVGSIGLRLPWQRVRVVALADSGAYLRDAPVGEVGTIVVKGPNLFRAYLNPLHNKGLWLDIPNAEDKVERWLNTGDLGRIDEQGYFWLVGRAKELIIRGGHNIDPKMIEEPMLTHPAVAFAAAVGRPDAHAGEVPVVYVQLRPGASTSEDELMAHMQQAVAEKAACPKRIHVVSSLPTTAVGKIFKPALSMAEMESVVSDEAQACGLELTYCRAERDDRRGVVVKWSVSGDPAALTARLDKYAFHCEVF